jgi:hypothetical protein
MRIEKFKLLFCVYVKIDLLSLQQECKSGKKIVCLLYICKNNVNGSIIQGEHKVFP